LTGVRLRHITRTAAALLEGAPVLRADESGVAAILKLANA
jgi:hypothetical protein